MRRPPLSLRELFMSLAYSAERITASKYSGLRIALTTPL
jgi:hypothetical protein